MKKKLMPQLLVVILFATGLLSCSNDDEKDFPIPEVEKQYEFISIQWKIGEDDKEEVVAYEQSPVDIYYNASVKTFFTNRSSGIASGFSIFESNDNDFRNIKDSVQTYVPVNLANLTSEYKTLTIVSKKALIKANETIKPEPAPKIEEITEIPPMSKGTINYTVYMRELTASYLITLAEKGNKNNIKTVEGKWKGSLYERIETKASFEEIN